MKELLKYVNEMLSNLYEKSSGIYIDAFYDEEPIPASWKGVINDLTKKVLEYEFQDNDNDGLHPFLYCEKELSNAIGFDDIVVCPYKGQEFNSYKDSNYMFTNFDNNKVLTIDLYDVYYDNRDCVEDLITQELFNFQRDATWIKDGCYENKLSEMERLLVDIYEDEE